MEDIRAWREAQFGSKSGGGRVCSFPLFGLDARDVLLPRLARLVAEDGVKIMFSSIESDRLKTWLQEEEYGDLIVSSRGVLRGSWPEGVDLMGENGEFHTRVVLN